MSDLMNTATIANLMETAFLVEVTKVRDTSKDGKIHSARYGSLAGGRPASVQVLCLGNEMLSISLMVAGAGDFSVNMKMFADEATPQKVDRVIGYLKRQHNKAVSSFIPF